MLATWAGLYITVRIHQHIPTALNFRPRRFPVRYAERKKAVLLFLMQRSQDLREAFDNILTGGHPYLPFVLIYLSSRSVASETGLVLCTQKNDMHLAPRRVVMNDLSGAIC